MTKRKIIFIISAFAIAFVVMPIVVCRLYLSFQPEKASVLNEEEGKTELNEPSIGFVPSYHEERVPLNLVANYPALKTKYGLSLTAEQEKSLDANRFLLVDSAQVPFLESGINFDQWLVDADRLGGGSIYDRKPEDAVLINPDLVLHSYHKYFSLTLEQLEQRELNQSLGEFLSGLHANLANAAANSRGEVQKRYQNLEAQIVLARVVFENKNIAKPSYFANPEDEQKYNEQDKTIDSLENANKILNKYSNDLSPAFVAAIKADLVGVYAADTIGASPLFSQYDDQIKTDYTQFTPRSHYTKNSILRAYFRTMMYLGRSSYLLKSDLGLADTNLLVKQMSVKKGDAVAPLDSWKKITAVTDFYVGQGDDLTYTEWKSFTESILGADLSSDEALIAPENVKKLAENLDKLRLPKILSDVIVDENMANRTKADLLRQSLSFRIFGQKFSYDAWILNDLTAGQEKTEVRLPSTPSSLFIPAAFGDLQARNHVQEFLGNKLGFSASELLGFFTKLDQKKTDISNVKEELWFNSLGSSWLYVLGSLAHNYGPHYPLYMQATSFLDKQIQTFLGSYTELKHDTLLYAKQSYAELGAGGDNRPTPPAVKGFVEPNLEFWNKFNNLLDRTDQLYKENNLFADGNAYDRLRQFKEISLFLSNIAEKELKDEVINDDEYERLRTIKLSFMAQPFEMLDPDEKSGKTALIADIHTDALQNQILYEATAKPYLMLAIVANEESPRVVAGLVYNHYELTDKIDKRLSDEDWQKRVYEDNTLLPEKNFWYDSLLIK
ncbi:MAG: DUF3160 domain-containing protein [Candidatus Falkowbacteria bacterium]